MALHPKWFVKPFDCGDRACINPHHWRVVRYPGSVSPALPRHPGFIQLASNGLERIERVLASRRDADEPARIIHRSHPDLMYSDIETVQMLIGRRRQTNREPDSDSTFTPESS